jgi:hypothetical protein
MKKRLEQLSILQNPKDIFSLEGSLPPEEIKAFKVFLQAINGLPSVDNSVFYSLAGKKLDIIDFDKLKKLFENSRYKH